MQVKPAAKKKAVNPMQPLASSNNVNISKPAAGGKAIEEIYQKKSQLEHILLRPDTYIGSTEHQQQTLWVHDGQRMVMQGISFVPGLYKIFDEILVNAADNKVRDASMDTVKIQIDVVGLVSTAVAQGAEGIACAQHGCHTVITHECRYLQEGNSIQVWNNGNGIPVEMHKEEKVYVPELIFGHLLTSSNYDDNEKKVSLTALQSPATLFGFTWYV